MYKTGWAGQDHKLISILDTEEQRRQYKLKCLDCLVVSYWSSFIILISSHTHTPNAPNHLCLGSRVCCAPCVPLLCVKRASAGSYGTAPAHIHTRTHTERWPSLLHSSLRVSQLNGSSWFKAQNFQRLKVLVWDLKVSCRFTISAAVRGGADMERGGASVTLSSKLST